MHILDVFNIRAYSAVFLCRYSMHILHAVYAHILLCYILMSLCVFTCNFCLYFTANLCVSILCLYLSHLMLNYVLSTVYLCIYYAMFCADVHVYLCVDYIYACFTVFHACV